MTIAIKKTYLLVYCRWNEARFWESNPSVWAQNNECVSPNRPPTCPDLSNSMLPMFPERNHNLEQYWLQASVREDLNLRCWDTKQRSLLYTLYEFAAAIVEVFGPEVREQTDTWTSFKVTQRATHWLLFQLGREFSRNTSFETLLTQTRQCP